MRGFCRSLVMSGAVLAMAGCVSDGDISMPFKRNLTWFSYLNGNDFRAACESGQGVAHRFVYNGLYSEQVRIYNVDELKKTFSVRVLEKADLSQLVVKNLESLLDPWRGTYSEQLINSSDMMRLDQAMQDSRVYDGASIGLLLNSQSFYWLVASCYQQRVHLNAYLWPSQAFENISFDQVLKKYDYTGIAFNKPKKLPPSELYEGRSFGDRRDFNIEIGVNGLVGVDRDD